MRSRATREGFAGIRREEKLCRLVSLRRWDGESFERDRKIRFEESQVLQSRADSVSELLRRTRPRALSFFPWTRITVSAAEISASRVPRRSDRPRSSLNLRRACSPKATTSSIVRPYLRFRDWIVSRRVSSTGEVGRLVFERGRSRIGLRARGRSSRRRCFEGAIDPVREGSRRLSSRDRRVRTSDLGGQRVVVIRDSGSELGTELTDASRVAGDSLTRQEELFFADLQTGSFDLIHLVSKEFHFPGGALVVLQERGLLVQQKQKRAARAGELCDQVAGAGKSVDESGLLIARKEALMIMRAMKIDQEVSQRAKNRKSAG